MRVAINGIGIAGPALAYWLRRAGHDVLLLESAPALRTGGYIVDFWGIGYDVAERMGVIPRIRQLGYQASELRLVDGRGRRRGGFDTAVLARLTGDRFTTVRRSDISAAMVTALDARVEMRFGDSISEIVEHEDRATIRLDTGGTRDVDLVVGADGLHSRVRHLIFGPRPQVEVPLGYRVAAFECRGYRPRDELVYVSYAEPGRQLARFALRDDRTLFLFIAREEWFPAGVDGSGDPRSAIAAVFGNMGWECREVVARLAASADVYYDRVVQIHLPAWSRGRTVLIGDAAACVSLLGGEGTGLAIAEAYVLAGELARAGSDHSEALRRYEQVLRPAIQRKQAMAKRFGASFVPATNVGLIVRDAMTNLLGLPLIGRCLLGPLVRDDVVLPIYGM